MGGQACVLYGAAEFSRDTDLAILADDAASLETALPDRNLLTHTRTGQPGALAEALREEEHREKAADRAYWAPLGTELERLRAERRNPAE